MPYLVEVWCEKTTMNDVLVPLCRKRRVNFVAGAGEMSETQTRLLMERAIAANKPVRIFYVSDFDPAGRSMPVAVSRRIEFYLAKNDHEVDMRLIPLVLSAQQCQEYNLPRTLIKETERRAARFEAQFGEGATELDALEALHPGTLEKLTDRAISRYLNPDYPRDFYAAATEYREALRGRCQINLRRAAGTRSRMRIHAAATAFRHSLAASARKIRSVDRETRWR
jgi:hypothetical protein